MRLLLVEDDRILNQTLVTSLTDAGYAIDGVYDGETGQAYAEATEYDGIILDILLPGKDGLGVCRSLRRLGLSVPILMLTARDAVSDRIGGLDSGADDYLVKPFAFGELLARLRALLRRTSTQKSGMLTLSDLSVDPATHAVTRGGLPIKLGVKEFALLEYLLHHRQQILSREQIERHIWNYAFISASNVVDVYIRRLRRQIDDPFPKKLIETIYGLGYRIRDPQHKE